MAIKSHGRPRTADRKSRNPEQMGATLSGYTDSNYEHTVIEDCVGLLDKLGNSDNQGTGKQPNCSDTSQQRPRLEVRW